MKQMYYLWDAGIDYIRLGLDCDDQHEALYRLNQLEIMLMQERAQLWANLPVGAKAPTMRPWKWMGAAGWTDGVYSLLRREKRVLVAVSGFSAHWAAQKLSAAFKAVRVDVALTVWYPDDRGHIPEKLYKAYLRGPYHRTNAPQPKLVQIGDGGATLYIGKRGQHHGRLLRCYDKWREQGKHDEWLNAIRYESELTGRHAQAALETMRKAKYDPHMAAKMVADHMRSVKLFPPLGALAPEVWQLQPQRPHIKPSEPLMWLNRQVRPSLAGLLAEGVPEADILAALTTEMGGEVSDRTDLEELRKALRKRLGRERESDG